jgi:hypothetical protein
MVMAKFDDLMARAKELNIPTNSGVYKPRDESWAELQISEFELHRRIQEEERHRREHKLWMLAVFSAVVSVISAAVALVTVINAH